MLNHYMIEDLEEMAEAVKPETECDVRRDWEHRQSKKTGREAYQAQKKKDLVGPQSNLYSEVGPMQRMWQIKRNLCNLSKKKKWSRTFSH